MGQNIGREVPQLGKSMTRLPYQIFNLKNNNFKYRMKNS